MSSTLRQATQNEVILGMLQEKPITPLDALVDAGCFRLAARIYELRKMGHEIESELIEHNGRHIARYRLA